MPISSRSRVSENTQSCVHLKSSIVSLTSQPGKSRPRTTRASRCSQTPLKCSQQSFHVNPQSKTLHEAETHHLSIPDISKSRLDKEKPTHSHRVVTSLATTKSKAKGTKISHPTALQQPERKFSLDASSRFNIAASKTIVSNRLYSEPKVRIMDAPAKNLLAFPSHEGSEREFLTTSEATMTCQPSSIAPQTMNAVRKPNQRHFPVEQNMRPPSLIRELCSTVEGFSSSTLCRQPSSFPVYKDCITQNESSLSTPDNQNMVVNTLATVLLTQPCDGDLQSAPLSHELVGQSSDKCSTTNAVLASELDVAEEVISNPPGRFSGRCTVQSLPVKHTRTSLLREKYNLSALSRTNEQDIHPVCPVVESTSTNKPPSPRTSKFRKIDVDEEADGKNSSSLAMRMSNKYGYCIKEDVEAESVIMGRRANRQINFWSPTKASLLRVATNTKAYLQRGVKWSTSKTAVVRKDVCNSRFSDIRTGFDTLLVSDGRFMQPQSQSQSLTSRAVWANRLDMSQNVDFDRPPRSVGGYSSTIKLPIAQRQNTKYTRHRNTSVASTSMPQDSVSSLSLYLNDPAGGVSSEGDMNNFTKPKRAATTPNFSNNNHTHYMVNLQPNFAHDMLNLDLISQSQEEQEEEEEFRAWTRNTPHIDHSYNSTSMDSANASGTTEKQRKRMGIIGELRMRSNSPTSCLSVSPHTSSKLPHFTNTLSSAKSLVPTPSNAVQKISTRNLTDPSIAMATTNKERPRSATLPARSAAINAQTKSSRRASPALLASSNDLVHNTSLVNNSRFHHDNKPQDAGKWVRRRQADLLIVHTARRIHAQNKSTSVGKRSANTCTPDSQSPEYLDHLAGLVEATARAISKSTLQRSQVRIQQSDAPLSMCQVPGIPSRSPKRTCIPQLVRALQDQSTDSLGTQCKRSSLNPKTAIFVPAALTQPSVVRGSSGFQSPAHVTAILAASSSPPPKCALPKRPASVGSPLSVRRHSLSRLHTRRPKSLISPLPPILDLGPSVATATPSIINVASSTPRMPYASPTLIAPPLPFTELTSEQAVLALSDSPHASQASHVSAVAPTIYRKFSRALAALNTHLPKDQIRMSADTDTPCEAIIRLMEDSMSELETIRNDHELAKNYPEIYAQACGDVVVVGEALFTARELAVKALEYQQKTERDVMQLFKKCAATQEKMQNLVKNANKVPVTSESTNVNSGDEINKEVEDVKPVQQIGLASVDDKETLIDDAESLSSYSTCESVEILLGNVGENPRSRYV